MISSTRCSGISTSAMRPRAEPRCPPGAVAAHASGARAHARLRLLLANHGHDDALRRGLVAWLVWQLMPRPIVTELAYQASRGKISAPADAASPRFDPAPAPQRPPAAGPAEFRARFGKRASTGAATPGQGERGHAAARDRIDDPHSTAKLKTSSSRSASKAPVGAAKAVLAQPALADDPLPRRARSTGARILRRALGGKRISPRGQPGEPGPNRRGMDGFRRALEIDPGHEAARQTMVALLLEAKRVTKPLFPPGGPRARHGEHRFRHAARAHYGREQRYPHGAFRPAKAPRTARPQPGLHAFAAALYQRLDRHKEAIEQYQAALRLAPSAGIWWLGLGISFQAVERPRMPWRPSRAPNQQGTSLPIFSVSSSNGSGNSSSCVRNAGRYREVYDSFKWEVPARFNIGTACCAATHLTAPASPCIGRTRPGPPAPTPSGICSSRRTDFPMRSPASA